MKIAVLNPNYSFLTGEMSMHRYAEEFLKNFTHKVVTYEEAKSYEGDVVICFNGRPDLNENHPPKEFKGLKIVHLQDHVFQAENTKRKLKAHGVEWVMAYNSHDLHDPFFQEVYKDWSGKVIPVPFGYNNLRFKNFKNWEDRKSRVVALGSVNPVKDPLCEADIKEFSNFFKDEIWTHKWRRMLAENKEPLSDIMESYLPDFPKTKDFNYSILDVYNNYKLFTTCESIMHYPSVKTFEGMACGSALVCSDHLCYSDLGLVDGVNCIRHKQYDLEDFRNKVSYYLNNDSELEAIAKNGQLLAEEFYNPYVIAKGLFHKITQICEKL